MREIDNIIFQKLRMSDREGNGSDGSLEEDAYEVEEMTVKVCWLSTNCLES